VTELESRGDTKPHNMPDYTYDEETKESRFLRGRKDLGVAGNETWYIEVGYNNRNIAYFSCTIQQVILYQFPRDILRP
jgi:hypothetical protein